MTDASYLVDYRWAANEREKVEQFIEGLPKEDQLEIAKGILDKIYEEKSNPYILWLERTSTAYELYERRLDRQRINKHIDNFSDHFKYLQDKEKPLADY